MLLVVGSSAFVIAHIAANVRFIYATFFAFSMPFGIESLFVRTSVVTRVSQPTSNLLISSTLPNRDSITIDFKAYLPWHWLN